MQLEELLGEELFSQVKAKIDERNADEPDKTKHIRYADLSEGGYIGRGKYDAMEAEKEALQQQVDTLTESLETLKKESKGNEVLQKTIDTLTGELEALKQQSEERSKTFALKEAMTKAGVLDPDYIIYKSGGIEKYSFDKDGNPEHLEDVLSPLREDSTMSHFFQRSSGYQPKGGTPLSSENPFAKEHYNLTKQGELLKTDPVKAREFAKAAGVRLE